MSGFSADNKDLSMANRKTIRDTADSRKASLDKIKAVLGAEYTLDFIGLTLKDFEAAVPANFQNKSGEFFSQYLNAVARLLEKNAADDMVKEGIVEKTDKKKIVIELCDKKKADWARSYYGIHFRDGAFVLGVEPYNYGYNIDDIANESVEKLL